MAILVDSERKQDQPAPVYLVQSEALAERLEAIDPSARQAIEAQGFHAAPGQFCLFPEGEGQLGAMIGEVKDDLDRQASFALGALQGLLPSGTFEIIGDLAKPSLVALAFRLNGYRFDLKSKPAPEKAEADLILRSLDLAEVEDIVAAVNFGRDLINRPANLLGTEELTLAARELANRHGASCEVTTGEALDKGFPMIAAVGRGSRRPPALIDIRWGDPGHRSLTLVGKGIVFDTGGLDIKPPRFMALMKKDMGGSAAVLALADLIMRRKLPIKLRVLVPTAENAIGSDAFRPSDVLTSRKGLTVEVGDTDAEGRLVLADALALAMEDPSELTIDMATLTGAARVALGPELAPFMTRCDDLAARLAEASDAVEDPLWRLPLWSPYVKGLSSMVADTSSITSDGFAGSITAGLFLEKFVTRGAKWAHFDIYGWNPAASPGRPKGGEVQGVRALFHYLQSWCRDHGN